MGKSKSHIFAENFRSSVKYKKYPRDKFDF